MNKIKIAISSITLFSLIIGAVVLAANTFDINCVKTAVDKREVAIQSAFDAFSVSVKSALQIRQTELSAAWGITDKKERNTAIKNAWKKFRTNKKDIVKIFNNARKATWSQFNTERKACKAPSTGESQGNDLGF